LTFVSCSGVSLSGDQVGFSPSTVEVFESIPSDIPRWWEGNWGNSTGNKLTLTVPESGRYTFHVTLSGTVYSETSARITTRLRLENFSDGIVQGPEIVSSVSPNADGDSASRTASLSYSYAGSGWVPRSLDIWPEFKIDRPLTGGLYRLYLSATIARSQ